jgi:hypothetical protein
MARAIESRHVLTEKVWYGQASSTHPGTLPSLTTWSCVRPTDAPRRRPHLKSTQPRIRRWDQVTSVATLYVTSSVVSSEALPPNAVSLGNTNPPVERSTSLIAWTPPGAEMVSVPLVVDTPTGFTKPATLPATLVVGKHVPKIVTNEALATGNSTRATSDPLAGFGKTNPSTPCSVFVMIKFSSDAPVLIAGQSTLLAVLSVHSKKCTVMPPINVALHLPILHLMRTRLFPPPLRALPCRRLL